MALNPIKLPTLPVNWREQPQLFERYWQDAMSSIETALNSVVAALNAADAAQAAADAAQTAADNANAAADGATSEQALVTSFPTNPAPAPLVSIDSTGAVTIANHDRQYGPGTSGPLVPVNGAMFATGAAIGDIIRIYYSDPGRTGGAVAYLFTVNSSGNPPQGNDIHVVGEGEIPGVGTQDGNGVPPPGYVPL